MARSVEQNQKMRDERRKQILSSALKLFALKGLGATKITDIVRESGMSQGLLYHYFQSKEEIFVELIRHALEGMNAAARKLEELPLTPAEKIDKAVTELLRGMSENEDFARYFLLVAQANFSEAIPVEAKTLIQKESDAPYEVMTRIMRAGQREGTIKKHSADDLALVFWVLMKGFALHKAARGSRFEAPDTRVLLDFFRE
jgi:AcrR family transcriptional regulator